MAIECIPVTHLGSPLQGEPSGRGRREARHTAGTPLPTASPLVKGRKNTDGAINISLLDGLSALVKVLLDS